MSSPEQRVAAFLDIYEEDVVRMTRRQVSRIGNPDSARGASEFAQLRSDDLRALLAEVAAGRTERETIAASILTEVVWVDPDDKWAEGYNDGIRRASDMVSPTLAPPEGANNA